MELENKVIRPIQKQDNPQIAEVIRTVMPEFGATGPGFAMIDPEVTNMFDAYSKSQSAYYVLVRNEKVIGGGGVAPLENGPADTCELKKMYFLPEARGGGFGRKMLQKCLQDATCFGFSQCYLETLEHMTQARKLYTANGFEQIDGPMGNTGHFGCDCFYLKRLK